MTVSNVRRGSPSGPEATRKVSSIALTLGTVNTNTGKVVTAALTGAQTTDMVVLNPTAALVTGLCLVNPFVSAAGVLSVAVNNVTAAAVAGGTATVNVSLIKYKS